MTTLLRTTFLFTLLTLSFSLSAQSGAMPKNHQNKTRINSNAQSSTSVGTQRPASQVSTKSQTSPISNPKRTSGTNVGQGRPSSTQRPRPNPTFIDKDGKTRQGVQFGLPTFAKHPERVREIESRYPIALPVLPTFVLMDSAAVYVDQYRSLSFQTLDELLVDIHPAYGGSGEGLMAFFDERLSTSQENLELILQRTREYPDQNATGKEFIYFYTSDANEEEKVWVRHVLSIGRYEDEGFHYIQMVCHYPEKFNEGIRPEVEYYFDNLVINDYR